MSFVEGLRARSPSQQALLAAIVAVVVASLLIAAYFLFLRQPYRVLFSDLRASDAATIVAELDKSKTPYRLGDGGAAILVPERLVDVTRLKVMSQDVPLKGTVGFELFNKSDMGLTEFAQKINYQRALQGELARTIMTMDPVDSARVHLSIPDPSVFREDRRPAKASVTVTPRPGKALPAGAIAGIQRLVAAAVPDLSPADVVVINEHGDVVSVAAAPGPPIDTPEAQEKAAVELYYAAKVRQVLQQRLPSSTMAVVVTATSDTVAPRTAVAPGQAGNAASPREFALKVAISVSPFPDVTLQEELRQLASSAIGSDGTQGDAITISPGSPVAAEPLAPAVPSPLPPQSRSITSPPGPLPLNSAIVAVLGLLGLFGAGTLWVTRRASGRQKALTQAERDAYVRRLKALLDAEVVDAASL